MLKDKCNEIKNSSADIEKSMDSLNNRFDDISRKIISLEDECAQNKAQISEVQNKLSDIKSQSRSAFIEIRYTAECHRELRRYYNNCD